MRIKAIRGVVAVAVTAGSTAVTAWAAPSAGASASDVVEQLTQEGYSVQLNGSVTVPLSQCTVDGVHGLGNLDQTGHVTTFTTAYVDVDCPSDN